MATSNVINLNSSGIASYDGAGAFSALASPLTVANGGTGIASATAYGTLCGGTTSTAALQVVSPGALDTYLTSNGAGALPTFQASSSTPIGRYITISTTNGNPFDSVTYYMRQGSSFTTGTLSGYGGTRILLTQTGEIDAAYGIVTVLGTLGSAQNCTINVRKNETTNYAVTTTLQLTAAANTFNNTTNFGSFVAGDYIDVTFIGPVWTTNPTTVALSITLFFTYT